MPFIPNERSTSLREIENLALDDLYVELSLQWPVRIPHGTIMMISGPSWFARWIERQMTRIGVYRRYKIRQGQRLFSSVEHEIHVKVCDEWRACKQLKKEKKYSDESQLAQAIAGIIETVLYGIPAVVITGLIMKIGVRRFCSCTEISS